MAVPAGIGVALENQAMRFFPEREDSSLLALWGLSARLAANMVQGVTDGFTERLSIVGVGFNASVSGNILSMSLGYSHKIKFLIPPGIAMTCETPTKLSVSGIDKQLVGQVVARICRMRKFDPYKGKGVFPERLASSMRRKEGKKK
jgi:large subunit ribosomal protein L6